MSTGVLIYCFDTEAVKYHSITNFCIAQITRCLSLPVTVVTDSNTQKHIKGHSDVVIVEPRAHNKRFYKGVSIPWLNLERANALEHSPYDVTVLMDSDYFVYTDNILQYIETGYDFLLHDKVHDLTGRNSFDYQRHSVIPMVWATLTIFKRTELSKKIFAMIQHIQKNYDYFCNLYRIDFTNFRNDYAFAIALNQIYGYNHVSFLPSSMSMLPADTQIIRMDQNELVFRHDKNINFCHQHDVHVLNKEIPIDV